MSSGCDAAKASGLIRQMMDGGFIYKIEESGGFPRIHVQDDWYLVPLDNKIKFDGILQCHFTRGTGPPLVGVYMDHRSGKVVATTGGPYGFMMK